MAIVITWIYIVCLGSFVPPAVLAAFLWTQGRVPLAGKFVAFQTVYLGFLTTLFLAFVTLTWWPDRRNETELLFNTLFFLWYAGLLATLGPFLSELIQRRWEGGWRRTVEALAVGGLGIPLVIGAVVMDGNARVLALRWALNGVYFVVFLATVAVLFVRTWSAGGRLADEWKRRTGRGATLVFLLGIPFFLVDALWPVLQTGEGGIPRGLNLQIVPVLIWNLWFTRRWFVFPWKAPDQPVVGELNPKLLELLTLREREIVGLILQGRTNQEITEALGVRLSTTKNHIYNIFNKTGVSSRKELGTLFLQP